MKVPHHLTPLRNHVDPQTIEWEVMRPALEELAVKNRDLRLAATANYVPSLVLQSHYAAPLDEGEEY